MHRAMHALVGACCMRPHTQTPNAHVPTMFQPPYQAARHACSGTSTSPCVHTRNVTSRMGACTDHEVHAAYSQRSNEAACTTWTVSHMRPRTQISNAHVPTMWSMSRAPAWLYARGLYSCMHTTCALPAYPQVPLSGLHGAARKQCEPVLCSYGTSSVISKQHANTHTS